MSRLSNNAITEQLVWVQLTYPDQSQFCFQTTLNPDILRSKGVTLEPNSLVRLDKEYYCNGVKTRKSIKISKDMVVRLYDCLTYDNEESREMHPYL